jgi:hypothetical protein
MNRNPDCHNRIQKFFQKVKDFFHRVFISVENFIDNHIVPILHFVEGLKAAVDNPAVDNFIEAILPGKVGEVLVNTLKENLGKVIDLLQIEAACKDATTLDDKIKCFIEHLRLLAPDHRDAIYHKIASILTRISAGEHVFTDSEIDTLVQFGYSQLKADHTAAAVNAAQETAPPAQELPHVEENTTAEVKTESTAQPGNESKAPDVQTESSATVTFDLHNGHA